MLTEVNAPQEGRQAEFTSSSLYTREAGAGLLQGAVHGAYEGSSKGEGFGRRGAHGLF